jgi:acetyl-CoA C-acetyltransferase
MSWKLLACSTVRRSLSTAASKSLNLTLLTSKDCSLCVHFKRQLNNHLSRSSAPFTLREIDIKSPENAKYLELYKFDIPVLLSDEKLLLKHVFDREKFEHAIEEI